MFPLQTTDLSFFQLHDDGVASQVLFFLIGLGVTTALPRKSCFF